MKFRWLMVFALGAAVAQPASSQVSVYADFSASKLTGGLTTQTTNYLVGPTIGLTDHIAGSKHLFLDADLRGGFYGSSQKLAEVAIGPKLGLSFRKNSVYVEALVGFGRYNDGLGHSNSATTDGLAEFNCGLDHQFGARWAWRVVDYSYEQYYALGGEYNPKTFSTGVVFHITK